MSNYFVDISSWNLDTDAYFDAIKNWGAKAVVVKISEGSEDGTAYMNPKAKTQIVKAQARGLLVHCYHYFRGISVNDSKNEAKWFVKCVNSLGLDKNSTIMVCDVEDGSLSSDRQTLTNYVNAFFEEVKAEGYPHVDIYTGRYWAQTRLYMEQLVAQNKWIAEYGVSACALGGIGAWQYASTTKFENNATDTNIDYNGFYTTPLSSASQPDNSAVVPDTSTTQPVDNANRYVDDLNVTWYKESGTFTLNQAINLRWGATTNSALIATLPAGSKVKYDAFCHSGGYVWIRQPRGNGQYGYLATGNSSNGKRTSYWGTFS